MRKNLKGSKRSFRKGNVWKRSGYRWIFKDFDGYIVAVQIDGKQLFGYPTQDKEVAARAADCIAELLPLDLKPYNFPDESFEEKWTFIKQGFRGYMQHEEILSHLKIYGYLTEKVKKRVSFSV